MIDANSNQEILDAWLPRLKCLFGFSLKDLDEICVGTSPRDKIWQLLSNLDTGTLRLNERIYVYSSMALFLEEEGKDPTEALEKTKHLMITNGGNSVIFEGNRFFFSPIVDTPIGNTLPLVILGETHQGVPLRIRSITLILIAHADNKRVQRLDINLNQCGVSIEFWDLDTQIFPEPTIVNLFITSDYLEEDFKILREHVEDFNLLPAETSTKVSENNNETPA